MDQKVETLLGKMTLEEKIGQLVQYNVGNKERIEKRFVGSFLNVTGADETNDYQRVAVQRTRLGIPLLFGFDVIHGYKTIYPIPLAEAASFDPSQAQADAHMAAVEASAAGIRWVFAPMVDIARDARWGRIAEGAGEDPHLGAVFAAARVRGFQRDRLVAACAKHFVGYGAAEGGRDYNTTDMSEKVLRDVYLPPFRAAVDEGVATLMSAFNDLNGVPASANRHTLTDILRGEWGFRGFVVSDWASIDQLIAHGIAADGKQAAQKALWAGVDMDMEGDDYVKHLASLVAEKRLSSAVIDESVRRILRVKFDLGLFEHPYADPAAEKKVVLSPEHLGIARDAARKSIVLLKNEANLLPLSKSIKTLAVMGPLADAPKEMLGCWPAKGEPASAVSLLAGIRALVPSIKVLSAKGCEPSSAPSDDKTIGDAVKIAQQADAVVLAVGETASMSGEAASRASLDLPGRQQQLVEAIVKTGKPLVVVLMNGRPLAIPWIAEHARAIVEAWHLGVQGGPAIAEVLFGDVNPGGKLPVTFPRSTGQVPIYYGHKNSGRPPREGDVGEAHWTSKYLDVHWTPLYPFGHGLSYTKFEYSKVHLSANTVPLGGALSITVDVKNAGAREGDEVVQLYIHQSVGSKTQPVKELKGFQRISLKRGETKSVVFSLRTKDLGHFAEQGQYAVEPGDFELWVGPSSVEGVLDKFTVVAGPTSP